MTIRRKADQREYSNLISNRRMILLFLISFFSTFSLWASSWWVIGENEPWDSRYPFYSIVMIVIGFLLGTLTPYRVLYYFLLVGAWLGQLLALLTIPWFGKLEWPLLTLIATALGSLWMLPGLFAGYHLRQSRRA